MTVSLHITHIDTACVLIEIKGYRILTDPVLDNAGGTYHHGYGAFSKKTGAPAVPAESLLPIDLILLSHHQHQDNFDTAGRLLARQVPLVISTPQAARKIPGITGLEAWSSLPIRTDRVPGLTITATPAQHHPSWLPGFFSGPVIGFVIQYAAQPSGVLFISGDTVYFEGIAAVGRRFQVDIGIFHVGSAQFPYLTGGGHYTMDHRGLIKSVTSIQPNTVVPIHHQGWSHFKETTTVLEQKLKHHPEIWKKTVMLQSGVRTAFATE